MFTNDFDFDYLNNVVINVDEPDAGADLDDDDYLVTAFNKDDSYANSWGWYRAPELILARVSYVDGNTIEITDMEGCYWLEFNSYEEMKKEMSLAFNLFGAIHRIDNKEKMYDLEADYEETSYEFMKFAVKCLKPDRDAVPEFTDAAVDYMPAIA